MMSEKAKREVGSLILTVLIATAVCYFILRTLQ